jgi:hypothetical protein
MNRSYYSETIVDFLKESNSSILGKLNSAYNLESLNIKQKNAWKEQIIILKSELKGFQNGHLFFEFSIPRMGKRADNILIIDDLIFILEFKVGSINYDMQSINQVLDYSLDLRNFHEGSHKEKIVPILISTEAPQVDNTLKKRDNIYNTLKCNKLNLANTIRELISEPREHLIDIKEWETSKYKPTPTIIEAAQALYRNHNVEEITRYEAGDNLQKTTNCLNEIINTTKTRGEKSICFVTGVPGAGKTLVGLNIVNERKKLDKEENAVFLSGNGPLVQVLREALAKDRKLTSELNGTKIKIDDARREFNSKIQNVHHFRDEYFSSNLAPDEKVVIFDESQRAWNSEKTSKFVKEKYGIQKFLKSEPEFLIEFMNRHNGWCSIICLVGGGQEINTGEAGIKEWINALKDNYNDWNVYYSNAIIENSNYLIDTNVLEWTKQNGINEIDLHLSVPVRSFRSDKLSDFVENILSSNIKKAKELYTQLKHSYPFVITRNNTTYKNWLHDNSQGSERSGLLISSSARRLRARGIDAENGVRSNSDKSKIIHWFLSPNNDIRSSSFLEVPATQFAIQGLELDWACLAWGGDLSHDGNGWVFKDFVGAKWTTIGVETKKNFLLNAYRVLMTRARQGLIIYIPYGDDNDKTRSHNQYDGTYEYLKNIGIEEV